MSKTSNFLKTTAILSTALFTLLGGCLVEDPIDYTTATGSVSDDGGQQGGGVLDSTAPVAVSLLIDNGASSTSNTAVTLDISATDDVAVTDYYASESAATPQASDSGWQSYQQSTSFTLSGSNSLGVFQRTVYVWFKDAAGNVSANSVSASISLGVYDTTAPNAVSVVIDGGADNTTSSSVTLTLNATDDQAVTGYYASESAVTPQAGDIGWDNYSVLVGYSFDNNTAETKTVNVWFKDAAGNVSDHLQDSINYSRPILQPGIRTNIAVSTVISEGWVECFSESYTTSGTTISSIQSQCNKPDLMMACGDSTTLKAAASAEASAVIPSTPDNRNTPRLANGTWWYLNNHSWGFSSDADITQNSCDTSGPVDGKQLCWHTRSNGDDIEMFGGYSCGTTRSNFQTTKRILFHRD